MRTYVMLAVALASTSTMLVASGNFNPADARVTLSQCISNRGSCRGACIRATGPTGQFNPWTLGYQYCLNKCDDNHAACVNFSMSGGMLDRGGGGKPRPPRNTNVVAPLGGGLLEPSSGFNPQAPAATGTPVGGGRTAPGQIR